MTIHHDPATFTDAPVSAIVDRAPLRSALSHLKRVVERGTIPIIETVRLTSGEGEVRLTVSDLDMDLTATLPAATDDVAGCVPFKLLDKCVAKAPACDHVAFDFSGCGAVDHGDGPVYFRDKVSLGFDGVTYKATALAAADFPQLERPSAFASFDIAAADLFEAFDATRGAISTEATRYYLNGIYCHVVDGALTFVATDGHRLARKVLVAPDGADGMPGVIIPAKAVKVLHAMLKPVRGVSPFGTVSVTVSDARIAFAFGPWAMTSKLVDGTFPDYQRVIPLRNDKALTVDADALADGLKAVAVIASVRGRAVALTAEADALGLDVHNPDEGTASATIPATMVGDPMQIGFNSSYLAEVCAWMGTGAIVLELQSAGAPTRITGARDDFDVTLMPMRV